MKIVRRETSCLVMKPVNGQHNVPTSSQDIEFHLNLKGFIYTHRKIKPLSFSSFPPAMLKGSTPAVPAPATRGCTNSQNRSMAIHTGASCHKGNVFSLALILNVQYYNEYNTQMNTVTTYWID